MAAMVAWLGGCQTVPQPGPIAGLPHATDPEYGYTTAKPVNVGGMLESGTERQYEFMRKLKGPSGEDLDAVRVGSCCPFATPNSNDGGGRLDRWRVTWLGNDLPVFLYINSYDYLPLHVPLGFTLIDDDNVGNIISNPISGILVRALNLDLTAGVGPVEALLLAQRHMILDLDKSALYDIEHALIDAEASTPDTYCIVFDRYDEPASFSPDIDPSLPQEEIEKQLLEQIMGMLTHFQDYQPQFRLWVDLQGNILVPTASVEIQP
jgi:hypothetical protein